MHPALLTSAVVAALVGIATLIGLVLNYGRKQGQHESKLADTCGDVDKLKTTVQEHAEKRAAGYERLDDHGRRIDKLEAELPKIGNTVNQMAVTLARIDERTAALVRGGSGHEVQVRSGHDRRQEPR